MTDEATKALVLKHDTAIDNLVESVKDLVKSNVETNHRLEEISKYLAKQAVFDTKLDNMDREITESFNRVHNRIDELDDIQRSPTGCTSVQLLNRDVISITKDVSRMIGVIEKRQLDIDSIHTALDSIPSTSNVRWAIGLLLVYAILFGSYVVTSIQHEEVQITTNTKVLEDVISDGEK